MPGMGCSVGICKSNSRMASKTGEIIKFFRFPKDPYVRKKWILKCYRKDHFDPTNRRICSKHFTLEDFEDGMQARLMNSQPKILKPTAIPSLHLQHVSIKEKKESRRAERYRKLLQKQIVDELLS